MVIWSFIRREFLQSKFVRPATQHDAEWNLASQFFVVVKQDLDLIQRLDYLRQGLEPC